MKQHLHVKGDDVTVVFADECEKTVSCFDANDVLEGSTALEAAVFSDPVRDWPNRVDGLEPWNSPATVLDGSTRVLTIHDDGRWEVLDWHLLLCVFREYLGEKNPITQALMSCPVNPLK